MFPGSSSSTRKRHEKPAPKRGDGARARGEAGWTSGGKVSTSKASPGRASPGRASPGGASPGRASAGKASAGKASANKALANKAPAHIETVTEKSSPEKASPFKQSLEKVRSVIEPVVMAHRIEMVELSWVTERTGRTLRLTIERSGVGPTLADQLLVGFGVSLEDCAEVSRDVSAALDLADIIPHAYCLEVSSPGLDRPLRHVADFVRFVGQTAKVKLREPASDGQRVLRGRLREIVGYDSSETADSARISIEVDGKVLSVPYSAVESANLVYELATQPKSNLRKTGSRELNHRPDPSPSNGAARPKESPRNGRPASSSTPQFPGAKFAGAKGKSRGRR